MLRRHLWLVRAFSAAGFFAASLFTATVNAEPSDPVPGEEGSPVTVQILDAQKSGAIELAVRGQGQDKVKVTIKNSSPTRLNVVLPPGLVASSATGQGGGGGFQSMGLGVPTSRPGSFGQFQKETTGFRSVSIDGAESSINGIAVAKGQTVELTVPSVCLNFGIPTPTPKDMFRLMTVEDYSPDVRVRKALKSLATIGTSQGVAQAVMWNVCNGLTAEQMATQASKYLNLQEIGLAARFVQALDASGSGELVEANYFNQARVLVRVVGEGSLAKDAQRLSRELDGQKILGLPARVIDELPTEDGQLNALVLTIDLISTGQGATRGRITVQHNPIIGGWITLGRPMFRADVASSDLDPAHLARAVDSSIATTFVSTKAIRRSPGVTTFKIENRLPFSIANAVLRTGRDSSAGAVTLDGLGLGPARSTLATIPAAVGVVESITLNGL
jgi:hypothetical protein